LINPLSSKAPVTSEVSPLPPSVPPPFHTTTTHPGQANPLDLDPQKMAAGHVASIIQSALGADSSSKEHTPSTVVKDAVSTRKRQINPPAAKPQSPPVEYNKLTTSRCQEILEKVADFYTSLSDFATSNGLNPVDVTHYALGGELKGAKMNCWKCFQLLSGMARNGHKLLFHLNAYSKY